MTPIEDPMEHPLRQLSLDRLRERTSVKWRRFDADVLPLWVAEMDVPLADPILDALGGALRRGDTGYAFGDGYATALAGFASDRWGWRLDTAATRLVPDVMLGSVEVLRLVTARGEGVVINPPVYPPFYAFVTHADRQVVEVPLTPDARLDLSGLERAFARPEVTGHLLCSPHNPTGTVHTVDELREVAALADRHGVRVVADEIHAPLVRPPVRFVPYLSLPEASRGIALLSASKAWNLAGIKAAIAVAGGEAGAELARMPEEVGHGASHLGVIAHTAAFAAGGAWLDALLSDLGANQELLARLLAERLPAVRHHPGDGTYLAWLDCRELGIGDDPAATFLERGRVALMAGVPFGPGGAGHVRLNLATTPELLTEAVDRMARALA